MLRVMYVTAIQDADGTRAGRKDYRLRYDEVPEAYAREIRKLIDSAKREVLEQIRPPQATIDSMKLTQPHKYRGVEYPCCSICGYCPEAINAFIDSQLEQSEESI